MILVPGCLHLHSVMSMISGSPQIMRILVNGLHWAAGVKVPGPEAKINTFDLEDPAHPRK